MSNRSHLVNLHSIEQGKVPTSDNLEIGEIAINGNSADPFISIKDSNGVIRQFKTIDVYEASATTLQNNIDALRTEIEANAITLEVPNADKYISGVSGDTDSGGIKFTISSNETAITKVVTDAVSTHNTASDAHSDIRTLISNETIARQSVDTALEAKIPTKLSDLTDDVVKGKYLSTSGGAVNGNLTISGGFLISADHAIQTPSINIDNDIVFSAGNPNEVRVTIGVDSSSKGYLTLKDTNTNSAISLKGVAAPTEDTDAANKKYVDDAVAGSGGSGSIGFNLWSVTYGAMSSGSVDSQTYSDLKTALQNGDPLYIWFEAETQQGEEPRKVFSHNCSAYFVDHTMDTADTSLAGEYVIIYVNDLFTLISGIGDPTTENDWVGKYTNLTQMSQQGGVFILKTLDSGTTVTVSQSYFIAPDASVSTDSENTVQNKVITSYVDTKVATINTSVSSISTRVTSVESQIGDIKTILASI